MKNQINASGNTRKIVSITSASFLLALVAFALSGCGQGGSAIAQAGPGEVDRQAVISRGDVVNLPAPLKNRLGDMAARPHSFLPVTAFAEADDPTQLFQYYLLDTNNFQPNVFTALVPGINDGAIPTGANAANSQMPSLGAIRLGLEPKPGLPTDPNDVRAFIDGWTDISGLFVINNESGWYEGWMIRDIKVPPIRDTLRADGTAQYGFMTSADAAAIAALGPNNIPGNFFTLDGQAPRFGSATDVFPDPARQPNIVPFPVSFGTFNAQQQSDIHAYWEFNPSTNWVFPHYELPFTGGVPTTFAAGMQYAVQSVIAGDGPGVGRPDNNKITYGDNPDDPRDPDRGLVSEINDPNRPMTGNPTRLETRIRFIPSGLTEELLVNVFVRVTSFMPGTPPNSPANIGARLLASYAQEVARVDQNADGVLTFVEADVNGTSDGGLLNRRLYLPATAFNRFAVTREINDGLLAPRFAPSQRGYVLSGSLTLVNPSVPASVPRDADNR